MRVSGQWKIDKSSNSLYGCFPATSCDWLIALFAFFMFSLVLVLQQALHVGIVCDTVLVRGHTVLRDKMHKSIAQHIPCNVQNHGETRCRNHCRKKNRVVLSATVSATCLATSFPIARCFTQFNVSCMKLVSQL